MTTPSELNSAAEVDWQTLTIVGVLIKLTLILAVGTALAFALRGSSASLRHRVLFTAIVGALFVPLLSLVQGGVVRVPQRFAPVKQQTAQPSSNPALPAAKPRPPALSWTPMQMGITTPSANPVPPSSQIRPSAREFFPPTPPSKRMYRLDKAEGSWVYFEPRAVPEMIFSVPPASRKEDDSQSFWMIAATIWVAGASLLLGWRLLGYLLLARAVNGSTPIADQAWQSEWHAMTSSIDGLRPVRLLQHASFRSPVTAGWRHPVIILPTDIGNTSGERRRAILAHELSHIQRADFLTQCIASIATSALWFHPLAWYVAARMRVESECAADDRVLVQGMAPEQYARHLLGIANRSRFSVADAMPVVGMARTTQLEHRLRALFNVKSPRHELSRRAERVLAAASMLAIVPLGSLQLTVQLSDASPLRQQESAAGSNSGEARAVSSVSAMPMVQSAASIAGFADFSLRLTPKASAATAPSSEDALPERSQFRADTVIEQSVAMDTAQLLTLVIQSGANVVVRGWDRPTALMRASFAGPSWKQAHARLQRTPTGVFVGTASEREGFQMLDSSVAGYFSARIAATGHSAVPASVDHLLEVWVPRRSNVTLQSAIGDFTIREIEGELTGSTSSGDVNVANVKGSAKLGTNFGNIAVSNSFLRGAATTQCGTVSQTDVSGGFQATTAFDAQSYQNSAKVMIIDGMLASDWCNPRLRRMNELPKRIEERNPYGDIVIDSAPSGGWLATGRAGSIKVRASGGHIGAFTNTGDIELTNVRGDATARSGGGNITVKLVNTAGGEHYVNAQTHHGTVTIEIPAGLDTNVEAEVVTTDSFAAKGSYSRVIDQYGFKPGSLTGAGSSRLLVERNGTYKLLKGRATGQIVIRVTDGDIIFTRAKH